MNVPEGQERPLSSGSRRKSNQDKAHASVPVPRGWARLPAAWAVAAKPFSENRIFR
jgi:hypothetical protein